MKRLGSTALRCNLASVHRASARSSTSTGHAVRRSTVARGGSFVASAVNKPGIEPVGLNDNDSCATYGAVSRVQHVVALARNNDRGRDQCKMPPLVKPTIANAAAPILVGTAPANRFELSAGDGQRFLIGDFDSHRSHLGHRQTLFHWQIDETL